MISEPRRFLKTKIVCTIGPASADEETLAELCRTGMDVARLNMAHGTPDEHRAIARRIRDCAERLDQPVALLADLQGSKIRIGEVEKPIPVAPGDHLALSTAEESDPGEVPVTYPELAGDLSVGDRILIADGMIELRVVALDPPRVETEVTIGGTITSARGVNLPGVRTSAPTLTEKDLEDLELALELDVDYVALSFVRRAADLKTLRQKVPEDLLIVVKIEKDTALAHLEEILSACDAVMVARGDLGTELPFEQVPMVQKRIVRMANTRHRPAIIATQMLETMVHQPKPTRAEISDVANAILDGTDAVMLAAETATGRFPVESVDALVRVIREIESSTILAGGPAYDVPPTPRDRAEVPTEVAVAGAVAEAVRLLKAPAVVTFTRSGFTARVVSSRRPGVPILAVADTEKVYRQLALVWGVLPVLCREEPDYENMWSAARSVLLGRRMAEEGDRIVVTAGVPFHVRGTTNMVRIETV